MAIPATKQLEKNFPLRTIEELNTIKEKINLDFLGDKSELRSQIVTTTQQEFAKAEKVLNEFLDILHSYNCDFTKNSEFVSTYNGKTNFAPLAIPNYPETRAYLSSIITEFNNGTYFLKEELQEIYKKLSEAYSTLRHQACAYKKGEKGEEYIKNETAYFSTRFKSLYNVRIPSENAKSNSAELDCVFATSKGLIVAEVKTLGSELDRFVVSRDGLWSKVRDGREEILCNSPSRQNSLHCLATENFLKEHGLLQVKIIPVILWASKAKVQNRSCANIIRPEMLYDFVEQLPLPEKYDPEFQGRIINLLEKNDLGDNIFGIKTFNHTNVLATTKELLQYVTDMYNIAKQAIEYKPQYPVTKSISNALDTLVPILLVIAFLVIFAKPILICVLVALGLVSVFMALGFLAQLFGW